MMGLIKSQTFQDYYGTNPNEYYIKYIHHNIDISNDSEEEYANIKEDFKRLYDLDNNAFIIYFSDVENYIKISNHIDIEKMYEGKIYLRIRNLDEYKKLINYNHLKNIKVIVDLKDLEQLDIKDLDLTIQIDKVNELPEDKLNELIKNHKIKEVLLGQIPYLTKDDEYLYEIMSKMYNIEPSKKLELEKINKITNDIYSTDDYRRILSKFESIINQLDIKNQLDGFYKIFEFIANNVSYDEEGVTHTIISNQNLIGPIFQGKAVCEGYSKYLQQLLSLININSIIVQAGESKEDGGHIWNQVFINEKWYNADVTVASYNVHNNEKIRTCLVNDNRLLYKTNSSISYICDDNFASNVSEKIRR